MRSYKYKKNKTVQPQSLMQQGIVRFLESAQPL